jgi:hypothetical protein
MPGPGTYRETPVPEHYRGERCGQGTPEPHAGWEAPAYYPALRKVSRHMPKAVVDLSEHANRVVNVVKARDGLRGKSEALESIVAAYEERILEPALRPGFIEELRRIRKGKFRKVGSLDELLGETP